MNKRRSKQAYHSTNVCHCYTTVCQQQFNYLPRTNKLLHLVSIHHWNSHCNYNTLSWGFSGYSYLTFGFRSQYCTKYSEGIQKLKKKKSSTCALSVIVFHPSMHSCTWSASWSTLNISRVSFYHVFILESEVNSVVLNLLYQKQLDIWAKRPQYLYRKSSTKLSWMFHKILDSV